jgi:hypothetical protein
MKKIFLLLSTTFFLSSTLFAQSIKIEKGMPMASRLDKAKMALKATANKSVAASNNLVNGNFEVWKTDSIESFSGKTIRFMHPDMWAPVNGIFLSYFLDLEVPISATLNGTNSAAKIEIADMGYGSDLATLVATDARPHNLQGEYQFNGADESTAFFEVIATKYNTLADSSEIIGAGYFVADENTNGTFENFVARIDYINETDVPDSIYVFASYLEGEMGTWFKMDNLMLNYSPTGLNSTKNNELKVYPNPSNNSIKIELANNNALENSNVEIRGIDGSLKLKLTNYESTQPIDISSLPVGLYILTVQSANGVMSAKINKI